jgi:hypothetical protein
MTVPSSVRAAIWKAAHPDVSLSSSHSLPTPFPLAGEELAEEVQVCLGGRAGVLGPEHDEPVAGAPVEQAFDGRHGPLVSRTGSVERFPDPQGLDAAGQGRGFEPE